MATNFPGSDDVFTEPGSPGSTALSSAGTGSRNHTTHHRDLGDAIEAMQAQATLLAHSHDGSTARHGPKLAQANTHQSPDTDVGPTSLHHTLGTGANQAATGNHTHSSTDPWPVGSVYLSLVATDPNVFFGGTWAALVNRFLVGAGDTYVAAATGGAAVHTHTNPSTSSTGSHTHTNPSTSTTGDHNHDCPTSSSGGTHTHGISEGTDSTSYVQLVASGGVWVSSQSHDHNNASSGGSHTHTIGSTDTDGDHSHTQGSTGSSGTHSHTIADTGSTSNLPPYLAVYMWQRTA